MQESILKSEIFFFIATISLVVISCLLAVLLVYGIKVFRDLKFLVEKVREEGEEIIKDVGEAREALKEKSSNILSFLFSLFALKAKHKKKRKSEDD